MASTHKSPESPATAFVPPATVGAAPADITEPVESSELLRAYMWSPPLLIAWGLGYMTDVSMFCCMVLMGLPLGTSKVVEALGGRGAWARKAEPPPPEEPSSKTQAKKQARAAAAADAQPPQPSLAVALRVPTSVWLPPIMLVAATVNPQTSPLVFGGTATGVYAVIVCGQYLRNRFFGVPKF